MHRIVTTLFLVVLLSGGPLVLSNIANVSREQAQAQRDATQAAYDASRARIDAQEAAAQPAEQAATEPEMVDANATEAPAHDAEPNEVAATDDPD